MRIRRKTLAALIVLPVVALTACSGGSATTTSPAGQTSPLGSGASGSGGSGSAAPSTMSSLGPATAATGPGGSKSPGPNGTKAGGSGGSGGGSGGGGGAGGGGGGGGRPDHVVVVVMENHGYADVVGSSAAPWTNSAPAAMFTDWHAIEHPSQPNYLDMFSGSNQGVTNDSCPHTFGGANLGSQLRAAGFTFTGYSEDLPGAGSAACSAGGSYARKHNPWSDFSNLPGSVNQPLTALPSDYSQLPDVAFVIPNLCHDTHNCGVGTGDSWLSSSIGPYLTWARSHNSLLIVTYDEDDSSGGTDNHITTLFAGAGVKPGNYAGRYTHFSLLRTLEDLFGLGHLGGAASANAVSGIWQ